MLKVILTAAALFAAHILGGISMLRFIRREYPATYRVWREEHKMKREDEKKQEAKEDA